MPRVSLNESIALFKTIINFELDETDSPATYIHLMELCRFVRLCLGFMERGIDYANTFSSPVLPPTISVYHTLVKKNYRLEKTLVQYYDACLVPDHIRVDLAIFVSNILEKRIPLPIHWDHLNFNIKHRFEHATKLRFKSYKMNGKTLCLITSQDCPWGISIDNPLSVAYLFRRSGEIHSMKEGTTVYNVAQVLLELLVPFTIMAPYQAKVYKSGDQQWNSKRWIFNDGRPIGLGQRDPDYKFQVEDWYIADEIAYKLLKQPHAAAAFQHGGPLARIAAASIGVDDILQGPSQYATGRRTIHGTVYVYDELSMQEINAIVGTYRLLTGMYASLHI